jgi:urease accessory protein
MIYVRLFISLLGLLCFTPLAQAHPGHLSDGGGFMAGFFHPLTGIDHVLFLLGVGFLIAQRARSAGGRTLLALLLAQLLAVCVLLLPVSPAIWEIAIALSLIALGILYWRPQATGFAAMLAVLGAGLHAAAHWVEMPAGAPGVRYGIGMLAASLLLYGLGYVAGRALRPQAERVARAFGISLAGGGVWMLLFG